jgi:hypothetical protein
VWAGFDGYIAVAFDYQVGALDWRLSPPIPGCTATIGGTSYIYKDGAWVARSASPLVWTRTMAAGEILYMRIGHIGKDTANTERGAGIINGSGAFTTGRYTLTVAAV